MYRSLLIVWLLLLAACVDPRDTSTVTTEPAAVAAEVATDSAFGGLVTRLSEPGGYFDTDNLISNETSYLHVVGKLDELGLEGGAYIGVGPDQNFSYIAHLRPKIAFIVDIRRDNLLQQLMYKSLFSLSRNRMEYLCLLFARALPQDVEVWSERRLERIIEYIDSTAATSWRADAIRSAVSERAAEFGIDLPAADLETIRRYHSAFIREGLDLRFRSHGRAPRPYYPSYRQLLLERDLAGRSSSYLASEDAFQFVRSLQSRNLVVPVVGDLAGDHTLVEIGRVLTQYGITVSAFYTSNVEFYLWRGGFDRFAENVTQLPLGEGAVIIRSYFGRNFGFTHPQAVPGYYSVQLLQTIASFVSDYESGGYRSYLDLVTRHSLKLRD